MQRFVQQVVLPLLPALQQHMVLALNVVKQPLEGGLGTLFNGKCVLHTPGVVCVMGVEGSCGEGGVQHCLCLKRLGW